MEWIKFLLVILFGLSGSIIRVEDQRTLHVLLLITVAAPSLILLWLSLMIAWRDDGREITRQEIGDIWTGGMVSIKVFHQETVAYLLKKLTVEALAGSILIFWVPSSITFVILHNAMCLYDVAAHPIIRHYS